MNDLCKVLGIDVPTLESVKEHREANVFALLLVVLLESGEPMTLEEVAARFENAGIAPKDEALASLKRCRPGRAPVYREGDSYHLDPHDDGLALWVFRLDLRPDGKYTRPPIKAREFPPLAGPEVPLTDAELDEAWKDASLSVWSAQRIAVAIIEAAGEPVQPARAVARVSNLTARHGLCEEAPFFRRKNAAIEILADGRWAIKNGEDETRIAVRVAVRKRIESSRRYAGPDPDALLAHCDKHEQARQTRRAELVQARRAVFLAFPESAPQWLVIADVGGRELLTFNESTLADARAYLSTFDILAAVNVRSQLKSLNFDPGLRRLAELRPPQATVTIDDFGRTMPLTTQKLITGSCGIARPLGAAEQLAAYLEKEQVSKLRKRLEANVISLCALYQYGRLHGAVRLRWNGYAMMLSVPWCAFDEPRLDDLMTAALEADVPLEAVIGACPPWHEDPFTASQLVHVVSGPRQYDHRLIDKRGNEIDSTNIQHARIAVVVH